MTGPVRAVDFPSTGGRRPSSPTLTAVLADALRRVDPELADEVATTTRWRQEHGRFLARVTAVSARSPEAATAIAEDGLRSLHRRMVLTGPDGDRPLAEVPGPADGPEAHGPSFTGAAVPGTGERVPGLVLPYRGELLAGRALRSRLDRWVRTGTVEPSCGAAVEEVLEHPEWLALPGRRVVLLGAAAELSPLAPLARWGADVLAVDLPTEPAQARVRSLAGAGAGRVTVPVLPDGRRGADLLTETLPLLGWLRGHASAGGLVLASHTYAAGSTHVRVGTGADLLAARLAQLAGPHSVGLAGLATPTDVYVVPSEVADAGSSAYARRRRRWAQEPLRRLSRDRLLAPAYPDRLPGGLGLADGLVPAQGPGYAMAKRVQRWRAVLAAGAGTPVSLNVAPASWTRSVTGNRVLAAAYAGAPRFGIEVFAPDTCRVLMAALLVHDLCAPSPARSHPEELFSAGAAHGGLWRSGYRPRSVLGPAALLGAGTSLGRPRPPSWTPPS